MLAQKVEKNRSEVKKKFTDLGARNVSSLKSEDYQEFMDFLNKLA